MYTRGHSQAAGILIAAIAGLAATGPAIALPVNPIDPTLPLTTHARVQCLSSDGFDKFYSGTNPGITCMRGVVGQVASDDSASANLSTGTLNAVAAARVLSLQASAPAGAIADLYDTLTVNGNWIGTRNIELRSTVHGTVTSNPPTILWAASPENFFRSDLEIISESGELLGFAGMKADIGTDGIPRGVPFTLGTATLTANPIDIFNDLYIFDPSDIQITLSYIFPATTENRTFSFLTNLWALSFAAYIPDAPPGTLGEAIVDFGNTARLSLIVPSDVTVSSASGQFLTAEAVPLPPAFVLLGSAAVLLAARRRLLRRSASESGRLRHRDGGHEGGDRRR